MEEQEKQDIQQMLVIEKEPIGGGIEYYYLIPPFY